MRDRVATVDILGLSRHYILDQRWLDPGRRGKVLKMFIIATTLPPQSPHVFLQ